MFIIIGNYGNETVALLQWAVEHQVPIHFVVSVDTGWASDTWQERLLQINTFVKQLGYTPVQLKSSVNFAELVRDRQQFPDKKHQWCVSMLKGITLNQWLDERDPSCEATILLGKWRKSSRALSELPEKIEDSEYYQGRKIWHPLFLHDRTQLKALIQRAGFSVLSHRSLECDPCIHNSVQDFQRISVSDIQKTRHLEREIGQSMFSEGIEFAVQQAKQSGKITEKNYNDGFYSGCGSPWGCGL